MTWSSRLSKNSTTVFSVTQNNTKRGRPTHPAKEVERPRVVSRFGCVFSVRFHFGDRTNFDARPFG